MSRKKSSIDDLFSERLKTFIEDILKVKQKFFAEKVGISRSYISSILNKNRGLSAELIIGLYIHYREYFHWLLTGEEEMPRQGSESDASIYNKVGDTEEDPEIVELVAMAKKVLKSGSDRADTLTVNIRSSYKGMSKDQNEENRVMSALEKINTRLAALEEVSHPPNEPSNEIRQNDNQAMRGDILKKRRA